MVEDLCLEARLGSLSDAAAKDQSELVRMANGTVKVQESVVQAVQRRAIVEDQVGVILDLTDEQAVAEALAPALSIGEERNQLGQPVMGAGFDVRGRELVGHLLQPYRVAQVRNALPRCSKSMPSWRRWPASHSWSLRQRRALTGT
jgi:hypothetical protein